MTDYIVMKAFEKKYLDYKIPGHVLFPKDDIALYKYSRGTVLEIGTYLGGSAVILSPGLNLVTFFPIFSTIPENSCPGVIG